MPTARDRIRHVLDRSTGQSGSTDEASTGELTRTELKETVKDGVTEALDANQGTDQVPARSTPDSHTESQRPRRVRSMVRTVFLVGVLSFIALFVRSRRRSPPR